MQAQQEVGYIERFALADDRREALQELIPGTQEFFYYHCLHYQNEGQLAEAEAVITQWRTKFGENADVKNMTARQVLLAYDQNPKRTLDYLRTELGLNFNHAPPSRDRAAKLSTSLDNNQITTDKLLAEALAGDRGMGRIEDEGLHLVLEKQLSADQLRAVLSRLPRADLPGVVKRIAEELGLKDSKGFGGSRLHSQLTLAQHDELLRLRRDLIENEKFIRSYTGRLAPPEGTDLSDPRFLREYLERLASWVRRLPPSQNSFKALVIGNLLRLDVKENRYDRKLFLEYLALPRSAAYYDLRRFRNQRIAVAELNYSMSPEVPLGPMGNDTELVRRYLEHFLRNDASVDAFASYLNRDYLDKVFAETKILYGVGDEATWYSKLSPSEQKQLRERIEIRFAPHNAGTFSADDTVALTVELKNVEELIVKIYEINTPAFLRSHDRPIGTDIDLDGLVANAQRALTFAQPAHRRHDESIEFPEMQGRGVWVVDFLGGGRRSRAVIQKGSLIPVERLGDAGHVVQVLDEAGHVLESAHIEMGGRKYEADEGKIILPYAEKAVSRNLLVVDGEFATRKQIQHRAENYRLQAGFVLDRQSLVAGTQAAIAVHTRLTCNGHPISIQLLEDPQLKITATDADGISTSQSVGQLELTDGDELVHSFLVPQRLRSLSFQLHGRVLNRSRGIRQDVSASYSVSCNGIAASDQIADFFLQRHQQGMHVYALGRNGEPITRLPISVAAKHRQFKQPKTFSLATDAEGRVDVGELKNIDSIQVSAHGIQQSTFDMADFHRDWPAQIQIASSESIELPLGKSSSADSAFTLSELRRGLIHRTLEDHCEIKDGSIVIRDLSPGDYVFTDHEVGQRVRMLVSAGKVAESRDTGNRDSDDSSQGAFVVDAGRILQMSDSSPIVIRDVRVVDEELVIQVDGADLMSRVHIVANVFEPSSDLGRRIDLPSLPLMSQKRTRVPSLYVDSLRLDEEYSYILERQGLKKYPGNLLPQPSLLINPWEISVTENNSKRAAAGDRLPKSAAPAQQNADMAAEGETRNAGSRPDWKSFDFLAGGAAVATNLAIQDGVVKMPMEGLQGYASVTVLAVHPISTDSRQVTLGSGRIPTRDGRLRSAFDSDSHLAQTQRVEFLKPADKQVLGDPKTRRLQTYSTLGDIFQLYSTILGSPEWEKFRFVTRWDQLSDDEKRTHYSEMACHELNFFLYHKDRKFFDATVRPLLVNKLDKQIVDRWLLGESLDQYGELWRVQRLNTLERILLSVSVNSHKTGTSRWLDEVLIAYPMSSQARQQRFEFALRGLALQPMAVSGGIVSLNDGAEALYKDSFGANMAPGRARGGFGFSGGGMGGGGGGRAESRSEPESAPEDARSLRRRSLNLGESDSLNSYFSIQRGRGQQPLFRSIDRTSEWAETQYYRVRISNQSQTLIPPNPFWKQYLEANGSAFLPSDLDLPCSSVNEALCALGVIDLPFSAPPPKLSVENDQLVAEVDKPTIVFMESIEATPSIEEGRAILVGQDIYLGKPDTADEKNRPVQAQPLLRGIPYLANVVVTNPTSEKRNVQVLTQLPAGSLPLAGSRSTRSTSLDLAPYSTGQVKYVFYFPEEGEFEHYGAQISEQAQHLTNTTSAKLRVLAEPESVNETTWSYVADWGSDEQVLKYLDESNLQQIDLSRIAFRLSNETTYRQVLSKLRSAGKFEPTLWAYAVRHNDRDGMEQLLQNRGDFVARLGPHFKSSVVESLPKQQMNFEHLDYKPLVVARIHRLGPKQTILNPSMYQQYQRLLKLIAHQPNVSDEQRLELCYYMLLQNRIDEALTWFSQVDGEQVAARIQYDYFDAYLDFYRGRYDRAAQIASEYAEYGVPRWQELFSQIQRQVGERLALQSGQDVTALVSVTPDRDRKHQLLTDQREIEQAQRAAQTPTLDLERDGNELTVRTRNIDRVLVNYYLMDIELLFSRKPFVSRDQDTTPVIQPNVTEELVVGLKQGEGAVEGTRQLNLPEELENKNLLVEVNAAGISRSTVLTANALRVTVVEPYGKLQVLSEKGREPIEGAYVKVYARHQDGSERFYKDGYTDLRGQFDYATLSTSELDTATRFSILVLDEALGAHVQEAKPPTR